MRIEWHELIERSPELAELKAGAASVAEQERWPWYERWLPTSTILAIAVGKAAERLGVDRVEVRPVALAGLVDAYRTAKQRLERKGRPRQPAAVP